MKRNAHIHTLGLAAAAILGSKATQITSSVMSSKKLAKKIAKSPLAIITASKSGAIHAITGAKNIAAVDHSKIIGVISADSADSLTAYTTSDAHKNFKKSKTLLSLKRDSKKSISASYGKKSKKQKGMKLKTSFSGTTASSSLKKPLSFAKTKTLWVQS
jgi:hypothetical protein